MLLLIDNYDSFTYNLVHFLGDLGARCVVHRNDQITVDEAMALKPAGIVLSPGPCTPNEAGICMDLVRAAAKAQVPLLGVCLGHQAIGQVFGGKVVRAPKPMHGKLSGVAHKGQSVFEDVPSPFQATRYHSLIVDRAGFPKDLEVTAETGDIVMGLRHRTLPIHGVQFHPESIASEHGHKILENFLKIAGEHPSQQNGRRRRRQAAARGNGHGQQPNHAELSHAVSADAFRQRLSVRGECRRDAGDLRTLSLHRVGRRQKRFRPLSPRPAAGQLAVQILEGPEHAVARPLRSAGLVMAERRPGHLQLDRTRRPPPDRIGDKRRHHRSTAEAHAQHVVPDMVPRLDVGRDGPRQGGVAQPQHVEDRHGRKDAAARAGRIDAAGGHAER